MLYLVVLFTKSSTVKMKLSVNFSRMNWQITHWKKFYVEYLSIVSNCSINNGELFEGIAKIIMIL